MLLRLRRRKRSDMMVKILINDVRLVNDAVWRGSGAALELPVSARE